MADEVDSMFQEAVEALRTGQPARARELLTRLLKTDQNNVEYWIWMSAAVETAKERVYCLQTALRIDPENTKAKRGLILLGALPPDENVKPFPLDHPRAWEEQLKLAQEKPKEQKPFLSRPFVRLAGLAVIGIALCGAVYFMFVVPSMPGILAAISTYTPGPSPTFTLTPTALNSTAHPSPTHFGPTPLWALLPATYTPTPFYNPTPRQPQSGDIFRAASDAYRRGNWEEVILYMQQITDAEPEAADPWYFIGEAYRFQGKYEEALESYEKALTLNPNFGPAYVGRARANLGIEPKTNPLDDLETAIDKDPAFLDAYLVRAEYFLQRQSPKTAIEDLKTAEKLAPGSALVQYDLARAYLAVKDYEKALTAAERANELDITLVPVYLVLGNVYSATNQPEKALQALQTYVTYAEPDYYTLYLEGKLAYLNGDYELALEKLDQSIALENDPNARMYRGLTHLELGNGPDAVYELRVAVLSLPDSFEGQIGLTRAYMLEKRYGNAYQQAMIAFTLAETDEQRAQVYYWRALAQEKMGQYPGARRDWEALLALPIETVSPEMRKDAEQHLANLSTPAKTPTGTRTPTKSPTPKPGTKTPTPTP